MKATWSFFFRSQPSQSTRPRSRHETRRRLTLVATPAGHSVKARVVKSREEGAGGRAQESPQPHSPQPWQGPTHLLVCVPSGGCPGRGDRDKRLGTMHGGEDTTVLAEPPPPGSTHSHLRTPNLHTPQQRAQRGTHPRDGCFASQLRQDMKSCMSPTDTPPGTPP